MESDRCVKPVRNMQGKEREREREREREMRDTVDVALRSWLTGWQVIALSLHLSFQTVQGLTPACLLVPKPHVQPTTLFITDMALNLNLLALDLYTDIYLKPNNLQVLQIVTVDL